MKVNALIADEPSRKSTFVKKKRELKKKLKDMVAVCDVKACAVVYNPFEPKVEVWPSKEGVEEVVSEVLELSVDRANNMVNQEAFLRQRIAKEEEELQKLRDENQNSQLREFMFACLNGKMMEYPFNERDIQDLGPFIDNYLNMLNNRIKILTENGEPASSSSIPHPHVVAPTVASPIENPDHQSPTATAAAINNNH